MFVPTVLHHQSCKKECQAFLQDSFTLMCWNVHKNNKKTHFIQYLEKQIRSKKIDLLLFQEATFNNGSEFMFPNIAYDAAANLEVNRKFYGVLTASKVNSSYAKAFLSEGQEAFIGPHKSMLLSSYAFKDKSKVLVLNVHVINFRENGHYNKELIRFFDFLTHYEGALIIAGDFNSWNKKRLEKLHENVNKLKLKVVTFGTQSNVKSFRGNHLDFIFYKGLELVDASVEKAEKYSDHNPLFARFKKI